MIHVCIGTPIVGQPWPEYAISLAKMVSYFAQHPVYPEDPRQAIRILNPTEGPVLPQNREDLATAFLKVEDATHLLFIDCDMGFEPSTLHVMAAKRQPIVAANYSMKISGGEVDFTAMRKDGQARVWTAKDSTGLEEAAFVGFGFCLIDRKTVEAVKKPRFPLVWDAKNERWTTEDYPFCEAAAKLGIPTYVDHDASKLVWHMGKCAYRWETVDAAKRAKQEQAHGE